MGRPTGERPACFDGPLDGFHATGGHSLSFGWLDGHAHVHAEAAAGRYAYKWDGRGWRFAGHGARPGFCGGCLLDPDPATGRPLARCPLCGAAGDDR